MQCQKCQSANPGFARYCNQCGTVLDAPKPLSAASQALDAKITKIQRYLPQGLTEKILNQRDRIEGERKHVTVMFCDMEGFMPLVKRLGPETAYTIMDEVYEILIQQVNDYQGTVNEMTGDGIMALFGAPIALEEAPQRALWSADAIHREIAAFNAKQRGLGPIRMRIGIHTGPVVVGTLGNDLRVEFKAVGDTVNLASRMEHLAAPGTTYVTREVYQLARTMFTFENLGPKVIKGRARSVTVYRARSGRTDVHRPRPGSERMIFSSMVGREKQLIQLEAQVRKVLAGTGGVVNIVGEAGIGKSRLVAELKQCEIVRKTLFLEGRALSMGRNLSFHPIIELLRQWIPIKTSHSAAEAFERLKTATQKHFGAQTRDILPFVATLMGLPLPAPYKERVQGIEGEALEKLIRKSMRDFFTRLSTERPLVIVIDDLHWADRSSLEMLESLFRLAASERILFVNLFRPGYVRTGQRILESTRADTWTAQLDLMLEPLDGHESEKLITNMLNDRGLKPSVLGPIIHRAGGNPYFVEEIVRSLIDQGAVVVRGGKFKLTADFHRVTIPHTIRDVLMARIDRLEDEARKLLRVAAVIGRSFFYRILAEVADQAIPIDRHLAYLKNAELIHERRRLEELEYFFSHALAQEAAYASILPEKRKRLHRQVADTIQTVFADKLHAFYGMLAYHYSRAESPDKAEEALIKAGEEAAKASASSEALHYYQEALALYRRDPAADIDAEKVVLLEKSIALALYNRGQYDEALEYFDRIRIQGWHQAPRGAAVTTLQLLTAFFHFYIALYLPFLKFRRTARDRDIQALDFLHKKCKALSIVNPKRFFIESLIICGKATRFRMTAPDIRREIFLESSCLFAFSGLSFRLSRKILESARKYIDRSETKLFMLFDFMQTVRNYLAGDWDQIRTCDMALVNASLDYGELFSASQYLYWHGCLSIYTGALEQAQVVANELTRIAEVYENDVSILLNYLLNLKLFLESRQLADAQAIAAEAIVFAKKKGFRISLLDLYSSHARIFTLHGDLDLAARSLKIAEEIRAAFPAAPIQLSIYARSKLELLLAQWEAAARHRSRPASIDIGAQAARACRLLCKTTAKAAQHRTEAFRLQGLYHFLRGRPRKGFKWLQRAVDEGERLGARIELARTYGTIGKYMLESGGRYSQLHGFKAEDYRDRAIALFIEKNLQWDLDRLE